jgi:myo-inositol catabolism protein IolC
MTDDSWRPRHDNPLFILAMDHRGSFGSTLFDVKDENPTPEQSHRMSRAKELIYAGLSRSIDHLPAGRAGVLVDEQYGAAVIQSAQHDPVVLAVPIEASGEEWFTLQWGAEWLEHVQAIKPAYAKVLVRDNPSLRAELRQDQLGRLSAVSEALHEAGVPLLYELLVPATEDQLAAAGEDPDRYDRETRPGLVAQVIADNQVAGVEPTLWKIEGLETVEAAQQVAAQARAGGRDTDLIVLGRDAPAQRLYRWLSVAAQVEAFVGFAIGRSIWEDAIRSWTSGADDDQTIQRISDTYLDFTRHW